MGFSLPFGWRGGGVNLFCFGISVQRNTETRNGVRRREPEGGGGELIAIHTEIVEMLEIFQ